MENIIAYNEYLESIKLEYIQLGDEDTANIILCLQCGTNAIKCELSMLMNLKQDKMADAWDNLIEAQNLTQSVLEIIQ